MLPVEKRTFAQSKFVPDISLIMDMSYVNRSVKDHETESLEVPGVVHGLLAAHDHDGNSHSPYNAKTVLI